MVNIIKKRVTNEDLEINYGVLKKLILCVKCKLKTS